MNKIVYDLILKLEQCDDFHNRCDYLLEHSEITYLLEYIKELQQENKQLKELKYKFFDNSGDEESFTLEDYLEISNKLYDYEQKNKQLREKIKRRDEFIKEQQQKIDKAIEYIKEMQNSDLIFTHICEKELLEILGEENE